MIFWLLIFFIMVERAAELAQSGRNARKLRRRGAVEIGSDHYPFFVALHAAWLAALVATVPPDTPPDRLWLVVFAALQPLRLWCIVSLGPYWTTRVLTIPGAPLIRRGPYRVLRHPNYLIVVLEIAVVPLVFGAVAIAAIFSLLNLALLGWRISVENAALAPRRDVVGELPR
jgi:methyltransferase